MMARSGEVGGCDWRAERVASVRAEGREGLVE